MKTGKLGVLSLCALMLFAGCENGKMTNKAKGGLIGGGSGAVLGALIGKFAGNAGVGAAIGTAVGAGAGVLIGNKMDKVKKAAAQVDNAKVEEVTDQNGLKAVKATFDSGLLFETGSSTLSSAAKESLNKFAQTVLNANPDVDVDIQGYTDNTGWKNSTAAQSTQKNLDLSRLRAQSVETYLKSCGVNGKQLKNITGYGEANPVGDNQTAQGREQNRRVEIYMYASKELVQQAESQAAQQN